MRTTVPPRRCAGTREVVVPELAIGLVVGFLLAVQRGLDPAGAFVVGGVVAVVAYLASCVVFPYRRCPLCGGRQNVGDNRGNYRRRWAACVWCKGERDNRRVGARLLGRG